MRKILVLLLIIAPAVGFAQRPSMPIDSASGKVSYTEVVQASNLGQSELYSRAREFFAKTYNSAQSVLQMDSREDGKLVGKAGIQMYAKGGGKDNPVGQMHYTISVSVKDGRYKYELTDFYHTNLPGFSQYDYGPIEGIAANTKKLYQKPFTRFLQDTDAGALALIAELKKYMSAPAPAKNEDW